MIVLYGNAEFLKAHGHRRLLAVAAGHRMTVGMQKLGKPAHASSADPGQVNSARDVTHQSFPSGVMMRDERVEIFRIMPMLHMVNIRLMPP